LFKETEGEGNVYYDKEILYLIIINYHKGHAVAQFVKALRNTPEGRGFDSRWFHWNFSVT
jgi:hypothetical protein